MATSKSNRNALGARVPREDTRLHHDPATAVRGERGVVEDAARVSDNGTAMSIEQMRAALRDEFRQEALPSVPPIAGWHLCWLSTTNSYDPIHKRMRLGYVPVKASELAGFESMRMNSGEFEGCIACNEMLLFKIREELFLEIMRHFHHDVPMQEEENLRRQLEGDGLQQDRTGRPLVGATEDSDGTTELGRKREGVFAVH